MRIKLLVAVFLILSLLVPSSASAIFGLSQCEKVKKQAIADQLVIESLVKTQTKLINKRNNEIKDIALLDRAPGTYNEGTIINVTLASYKKILSSFIKLNKNQKCLNPNKYAEVLTLIESYKKGVAYWSNTNLNSVPTEPMTVGTLVSYLK